MINQEEQEQMITDREIQSESIKLIKNSKGVNWEIRILSLDVDKLESLNKKMIERFGILNK